MLTPGRDETKRPDFQKCDLEPEHQQNFKDIVLLTPLVDELKRDLGKANPNIIPAPAARKANEIEKMLTRIRSRLERALR